MMSLFQPCWLLLLMVPLLWCCLANSHDCFYSGPFFPSLGCSCYRLVNCFTLWPLGSSVLAFSQYILAFQKLAFWTQRTERILFVQETLTGILQYSVQFAWGPHLVHRCAGAQHSFPACTNHHPWQLLTSTQIPFFTLAKMDSKISGPLCQSFFQGNKKRNLDGPCPSLFLQILRKLVFLGSGGHGTTELSNKYIKLTTQHSEPTVSSSKRNTYINEEQKQGQQWPEAITNSTTKTTQKQTDLVPEQTSRHCVNLQGGSH